MKTPETIQAGTKIVQAGQEHQQSHPDHFVVVNKQYGAWCQTCGWNHMALGVGNVTFLG